MNASEMKKPLLILLLVCCLTGDLSFGQVDVAAPVNTYWGYGGDPELQISVNVTADDGWENITVSVRTPEGEIFPATTESSGSETSRIYSYTIKSLYIAYAGIYIFTAENIQDITITDSENVTVYIYTLDVNPPLAQRALSERDTSFTSQIYVTTDASWDDVTVTLQSPTGNPIPTEIVPTSFSFWRIYTADVNEIVAGSYNFTVQETLGGQAYVIISQVVVELYAVTDLDEYLHRFELLTNITESVPNFYRYLYDAPENNYIRDGGHDMYDRGNYISVSSSSSMEMNIPYGTPVMLPTFSFSSKAMYPFSSLVWISNENNVDSSFSIRVNGKTGSHAGSNFDYFAFLQVSSYEVNYMAYEIYGDIDPTICQVYFSIENPEVWSSVFIRHNINHTQLISNGFPPTSIDNTFVITGEIRNVMMGYILLSRPDGGVIIQREIEEALTNMLLVIEERDAFSLNSSSTLVSGFEESATMSVRVKTPGNWDDTEVSIMAPSNETTVLTEYIADGASRIYDYVIESPRSYDSGIYVFTATDVYDTVITSQTELSVIVAELAITEPEYWAVIGDAQLLISVNVIANIWDDLAVQVITPNKIAYLANTTSNDNRTRLYTHVITDISVFDVGVYTFAVLEGGKVGSDSVQVTVNLFTMTVSPGLTNYRVTDRDTSLTMSVYLTNQQNNWNNIQVKFGGTDVIGESQINYVDMNTRQYLATVPIDGVTDIYDITAIEVVAGKEYPVTVTAQVQVFESNIVDEYLYRIAFQSDSIVSSIPGFYKYWYDDPNNSHIEDGGNNMYNGGNFVSFGSSSEMKDEIPYGQPLVANQIEFSSKQTHPFVSMMWIDNTDQSEEYFNINVRGQAGSGLSATFDGFNGTVTYESYEVFYNLVQVHSSINPSICEVYFTISNTEIWDSVLTESVMVNPSGVPPVVLNNSAIISGSPRNLLFGYTLLAKSNGAQLLQNEVESVMRQFAVTAAEKDEFVIAPTQGGEYVESTSGDSVVLSVYVSVDGSWDEVRVEVITPTSTEEVTDYDTEILQNRREYKYTISNPSYSDLGNYTFIATDKYQYNIMQTTYLYVYTTTIESSEAALNANQNQQSLELSVLVFTETDWNNVMVMVEGPSGLQDTLNEFTSVVNNRRTYVYAISDVTVQNDAGSYVFTATETTGERSNEMTTQIEVSVFSLALSGAEDSLTTDEGSDIFQISFTATSFGDWNDVIMSVSTPSRGRQPVTEYDGQGTGRTYTYTMRDVTLEDAGAYDFIGTETLNGEAKDSNFMIEVVVKEAKLSSGEIAGIVIGSIAGAAIIIGLLFYCVKSNKNKKKESLNAVDDITLPEKMKTPPKEDVEYNSSKTKF